MHVASAAAATLWCFRSSSVRLYLTFISLSAFPSICLPVLALGGGGRGELSGLFICSLFPLPIQYEGESYRLWTGFCTWLDTICYLLPVFVWKHSLWSSLKSLHSAKRFRWLRSITDEERLRGAPVIKHLPLLMAAHCNSHSSSSPITPSVYQHKKDIKVLLKLVLHCSVCFSLAAFYFACMLGWTHFLKC